jgi:hypothetical protein
MPAKQGLLRAALLYLAFFVYPLGDLIGDVALDERTLEYVAFVAPG